MWTDLGVSIYMSVVADTFLISCPLGEIQGLVFATFSTKLFPLSPSTNIAQRPGKACTKGVVQNKRYLYLWGLKMSVKEIKSPPGFTKAINLMN